MRSCICEMILMLKQCICLSAGSFVASCHVANNRVDVENISFLYLPT